MNNDLDVISYDDRNHFFQINIGSDAEAALLYAILRQVYKRNMPLAKRRGKNVWFTGVHLTPVEMKNFFEELTGNTFSEFEISVFCEYLNKNFLHTTFHWILENKNISEVWIHFFNSCRINLVDNCFQNGEMIFYLYPDAWEVIKENFCNFPLDGLIGKKFIYLMSNRSIALYNLCLKHLGKKDFIVSFEDLRKIFCLTQKTIKKEIKEVVDECADEIMKYKYFSGFERKNVLDKQAHCLSGLRFSFSLGENNKLLSDAGGGLNA